MSYQQDFVTSIIPDALKYQVSSGVPAAVIVAQACLETGYGKSVCHDKDTGKDSKNLFNIKGTGSAGSVQVWTTEYVGGVRQKVVANFRAYRTYQESFADHAKLLTTASRYAGCMRAKNDPEEFARQLQKAGYATDPQYANKLILIMRRHVLLTLKPPATAPVKPVVAPKKEEVITLADLLKNQPWAVQAVKDLKAAGLISSDHDPDEPVKFAVLAQIQLNIYKKLMAEIAKK